MYFAKNIDKIIGKNISKNLSGKYSQNLLYNAKKSVTDALYMSSNRVIQKTAKETGDLIGNKIPDRIAEVSKNSQQNNLEKLQTRRIEKYLKKDMYLQEKDKKLFIILILIY